MAKKKAIKIAAASAMAASSFAAVASVNASAASNVDTLIQQAVDQMQAAQDAFANPATQQNKAVDASVVQAEITKAQALYAQAKAAIAADGKWTKTRYAKLATTMHNFDLAVAYVNGKTIAEQFNKQVSDLNAAVQAKDLDKVNQLLPSVQDWSKNVEAQIRKATIGAAAIRVTLASVDFNNANTVVANATKFVADSQTPQVTGVSAINAKQIKVTFSKAVDPATVITPAASDANNGTLNSGVVTVTRTSTDTFTSDVASNLSGYVASLSTDGKTLTVTAAEGKYFKGNYDVAVKGVKTADDVTTLDNYYNKFTINDTTAPTVTGVAYNPTTDKFEVTLSKPIDDSTTGAVLRINGTPVTGGFDAVTAPTNVLTFDRGSVAFGSNPTIYIAGLKDAAGNLITSYTGTVNVSKDTSALSVSSIQQVSNNVARVTFNKKLNTASDAAIKAGTGLVVTKPDGNTTTKFTVVAAPASVNPNGNVYDVTFSDTDYTSSNSQSFTVTFVKGAFTDVTGNTNALTTQTVTLNKDVTAPYVVSTKLSTDGSSVELTLSKPITTASLATGVTGGLVKLRKDGAELTGVSASVKPNTNNSVIVVSTTDTNAVASGVLKSGSYVVRLESGAFQDVNGNNVAATNAPAVTVASTATSALDVTLAQGGTNTFTVTAPTGQTFTTASLAYTHFTLDGVTVPASSDITLNSDRSQITVKLPTSDSSNITGSALFAANGLSLESGTPLNNASKTLTVTDNTAPTLTAAQLVGSNVIKLTFSENLGSITLANASALVHDLEITNGTVDYNAGLSADGTTDTTPDAVVTSVNGNSLVVTVSPDGTTSNWATVVGSSTVQVKTKSGANVITDANGVDLRSGTTVTLSK